MKNYLLPVVQHKIFYPMITLVFGIAIVYYIYNYHIKKVLKNIQTIERNYGMIHDGEMQKEIKKLKFHKNESQERYNNLLASEKKYQDKLYRDNYNVVLDVLNKLNSNSFNIYTYTLNDEYDNIDLKISGSYLNLIKLLDFLQTIKANVEINTYNIELVDEKMFIDINIEIGIL